MSQIAVATTIGTVLDRSRVLRCDAVVYAGAACAPRLALIRTLTCLYFMHGPTFVDQAWRTGMTDSRAERRAIPEPMLGGCGTWRGVLPDAVPVSPSPQSRNGWSQTIRQRRPKQQRGGFL